MNKHNNCLLKFRVWSKKYQMFTNNPMWPSNQRTSEVFLLDSNGELREFVTVDGENFFWDLTNNKKEDLVVQRYTGFKHNDKNEIYEGDIIDLSYSIGHERDSSRDYYGEYKVEFKNGEWKLIRVKIYDEDDWYNELSLCLQVDRRVSGKEEFSFKIIGNTFENPELIK